MESNADYICTYCGEHNTTTVDVAAGIHQDYVVDCPVCTRPNCLYVTIDEDSLEINILTDYAG